MKFLLASVIAVGGQVHAAELLTITVSHELDAARPAETITVPWAEVNRVLPGALLQRIVVRDAAGHVLPYQVTNVLPQASDPENKGIAYGELIFQHDFARGEQSASFTVEKSEGVAPPFTAKVGARYVPERLDDFAWENDRIAHRTYGAALAAPATAGSDKEVLVTSGIDVWFKRVAYPVLDRWYNKGHDHYHKDEGEGLDMYSVGTTRGAGGTGIWDGTKLFTSRNYTGWKVIANGPIRAVFELSYDSWGAGGVKVSEVKRFTVDAGHDFDQVESTFTFSGPRELTAAIGLNKAPASARRHPTYRVDLDGSHPAMLQWVTQNIDGDFGVGAFLDVQAEPHYAEDAANHLMLVPVRSGQPLRYFLGTVWSKATAVGSEEAWRQQLTAERARRRAPVRIKTGAS
jgi:pectinesterase